MVKRFQNKISGSRFLLATVAVITVLVWFAAEKLSTEGIINLGIMALTTYMLVEMDTRNSLIRSYSRMIPSSFLVLTTMSGVFTNDMYFYTSLLWVLFFCFTFSAYQDKQAAGKVFYAFLFLGIISILFVQSLFLVPVIWFLMMNNIMSMGRRTFTSSIIGLLLPYWFIFGYLMIKGDLSFFNTHFSELCNVDSFFDLSILTIHQRITAGLIALLSVTGIVHYIRNSHKDKIRTRMFCEMIMTVNVFIMILILLLPAYFTQMLSILVITTSVLISHYIVLTNTRITNFSVYLIIILTAAATVYNIWIS